MRTARAIRTTLSITFSLGLLLAPPVVAPANAAASGWQRYNDRADGITMMYPTGWTLAESPEANVAFKVTAGAASIELHKSDDSLTLPQLVSFSESALFPKLTNYKNAGAFDAKWGQSNRFTGPARDITFNIGAIALHQRWYFFHKDQHNYILVLSAPEETWAKELRAFEYMLRTFDVGTSTASTTTKAGSSSGWQLTKLTDSALPISISYPNNWTAKTEHHGEEKHWQIKGNNSAGHAGELNFYTFPRGEMTLDRFAEQVEEEHLKPQPNYRKLTSGRKAVGGMDGITELVSLTSDGAPAKVQSLFFVDRDHCYGVTLLTVGWSDSEIRDLFDRVSGSIHP